MCLHCASDVDFLAAVGVILGVTGWLGVRRVLELLGVITRPSRAERDMHVVAFLRRLDLDPVAILGPRTTAAADAAAGRRAAARPARRGAGHRDLRLRF